MQLHTCGPSCPPNCPSQPSLAIKRDGERALTIDMHCHAVVPQVEAQIGEHPAKIAEMAELMAGMGPASVEHNNKVMLPSAGPRLVNLDMRLADMDSMGVDIQVVSPSPTQYYYWADADLAESFVRVQNEAIAELCEQHPTRLMGLGNAALQHPELSVRQLEYAVQELGLKGVEISTTVGGVELSDRRFDAFWAKCEELSCVVFIHPFGTSLGERINQFYLGNTIGQPLETTVALSSLIFDGTLDRHPGLKLLAAHGGGYLPTYIGRSDHAWRVRPEAGAPRKAPSEYLRQIWFDTVVYQPLALRHLIEQVGVDQVIVGTDYPFDMGHYQIHQLLDAVEGLDEEGRKKILSGNARKLLGLVRRQHA